MTSIIFTVVPILSVVLIFIACQLLCWFTEPRVVLGMGRAFPTVTMAIAWLTLVAYGIVFLFGASPYSVSGPRILTASAFVFLVVGTCSSAVFLVVECVLLIECGMTRWRRPGAVWWH